LYALVEFGAADWIEDEASQVSKKLLMGLLIKEALVSNKHSAAIKIVIKFEDEVCNKNSIRDEIEQ
jgi:hypothetical protein